MAKTMQEVFDRLTAIIDHRVNVEEYGTELTGGALFMKTVSSIDLDTITKEFNCCFVDDGLIIMDY